MGWTIEYDPRSIDDLNRLDRSVRAEIVRYLATRVAQADNPRQFGKPLRHDKFGLWRYRVRDYLIVCEHRAAGPPPHYRHITPPVTGDRNRTCEIRVVSLVACGPVTHSAPWRRAGRDWVRRIADRPQPFVRSRNRLGQRLPQ